MPLQDLPEKTNQLAMIPRIAVSIIPVMLFLVLLLYLDSLKLVRVSLILASLGWGLVSAVLAFFINTALIRHLHIGFELYSSFFAPFVEEIIKILILVLLIRRNRVGFMIDGAIYGFAAGTAFALAENLFYLVIFSDPNTDFSMWITRGFGTAVMHAGTSALSAIVIMSLLNRQVPLHLSVLAGITGAVFFHGLYNQFLVTPLLSTLLMVMLLPVAIVSVFRSGETGIRKWMDIEFETEVSMLRMIRRGQFSTTRPGAFLLSVRSHFSREVVVDLYCFIGLYLELSIRAKTMLMMREQGFEVPHDPGLDEKFTELEMLEKRIGKAGLLAMAPVFRMSRKDLWKLKLLR
jgi:RsiW-degrading membrane proteinase PrsW (M82 family)